MSGFRELTSKTLKHAISKDVSGIKLVWDWCNLIASKITFHETCLDKFDPTICNMFKTLIASSMLMFIYVIRKIFFNTVENSSDRILVLLESYMEGQKELLKTFVKLHFLDIKHMNPYEQIDIVKELYNDIEKIIDKGRTISGGTYIGYLLKTTVQEEGILLLNTIQNAKTDNSYLTKAYNLAIEYYNGKKKIDSETLVVFSKYNKDNSEFNILEMLSNILSQVNNVVSDELSSDTTLFNDLEINNMLQITSYQILTKSYPEIINKLKLVPEIILKNTKDIFQKSNVGRKLLSDARFDNLIYNTHYETESLLRSINLEYDSVECQTMSNIQTYSKLIGSVGPVIIPIYNKNCGSKEDIEIGITVGNIVILLTVILFLVTMIFKTSKKINKMKRK